MKGESSELYNTEKELNDPLSIGETKVASAPYRPKEDAPLIFEMNSDPRIIAHFGPDESSIDDIEKDMSPEQDINKIKELLDPGINYEDAQVLERRIHVTQETPTGKEYPLVGWVSIYRSYPNRIARLHTEGVLTDENFKEEIYPTLEIAYAKRKEAQSGLLFHGIQSELYRIYGQALEQESQKRDFDQLLASGEKVSYNELVPLRVIATVDLNNPGSESLLQNLGFKKKGETAFETKEEAEDPENPNDKPNLVYELDWDSFMKKVDDKVKDYFESKLMTAKPAN